MIFVICVIRGREEPATGTPRTFRITFFAIFIMLGLAGLATLGVVAV